MGTVIQDAELQAGFQVMVRWYVSASQRYPADENEYYSTFFQTLEPNQEFVLSDDRFNLADVNDPNDELEYIIRDICYVQTLVPQTIAFDYTFPGYIRITSMTEGADLGATTITVEDASALDTGALIILGPIQSDQYEVASRDMTTNVITLATPLTRDFPQGTDVNENAGAADGSYPDNDAATSIARVLDNEGNPATDPLEVTTPLFYDTSEGLETLPRYYYTSALNTPFNGARGAGEQVNRPPIMYNGQPVVGRWWAIGDEDESAATRACLIDSQGFTIACRDAGTAFDLLLTYSATSENSACVTSDAPRMFFADHPNFRTQTQPAVAGTTIIRNPDGSNPPAGYYAWTSTIAGDAGQRFVRFWDGTQFLSGIVGTGTVDNCPLPLPNSVMAEIYSTEVAAQCRISPPARTQLYYEPIAGTNFQVNNVRQIYTNQFGPNADAPSELNTSYLRVGNSVFLWNGTTLSAVSATCPGAGYCGDPSALNTGSARLPNDFRDDSLCEYPTFVCNDPTASNFQPTNPPRVVGGGTCNYTQYTASFNVTNNIVGPPEGYTITNTTDTQDNGQAWSITSSVTLNGGFRWITTPSPLSTTRTGTFAGRSVIENITYTGEVATSQVPGCNTSGALNFNADSDGSQDCFFSIGTFARGSSDTTACDAADAAGGRTITLVRSDGDSNIREYDTTTNMRLGGANGWYSDGTSFFNYVNGQLQNPGGTTCPVPNPVSNVRFTSGPTNPSYSPGRTDVVVEWDGASTNGNGFVVELTTTSGQAQQGFGTPEGTNRLSTGFNNVTGTVQPGNYTITATVRENTSSNPLAPAGGRVLGRVSAPYTLALVPSNLQVTGTRSGRSGRLTATWDGGVGPFEFNVRVLGTVIRLDDGNTHSVTVTGRTASFNWTGSGRGTNATLINVTDANGRQVSTRVQITST